MSKNNIGKIQPGFVPDDNDRQINASDQVIGDIEKEFQDMMQDDRNKQIRKTQDIQKQSTDGPIGNVQESQQLPLIHRADEEDDSGLGLSQSNQLTEREEMEAKQEREMFRNQSNEPEISKKGKSQNSLRKIRTSILSRKATNTNDNHPTYTSRRLRQYEDDQSQDSDADNNTTTQVGKELQYINTQGDVVTNKPNARFKNYSGVFKNLIKNTNVATMYPIVNMSLSFDSTKAITVTKKSDRECYIKMYDLETYEMTFEEKIGGEKGDYIKIKEVEQNSAGNFYACCYNNDGKFMLRTFGKESRTEGEIKANEVNFNDLIGLDSNTMCIFTFSDPFMNCSFISDTRIFVNMFHSYSMTHWHCIYNLETRQLEGLPVSIKIETSKRNFPYKSFYNDELNEIYSFYRQGQSIIINADKADDFVYDRMTEMDLGQMCLVYNDALIARSSSDILFFKIEKDEDTGERRWVQYCDIEVRGFIYYIKGNIRIQITTDEKIFFYLIDKDTLEPILENVMFNFMQCNQMMFGKAVKYCVTYKTNQKSFDIYRRKFWHDFKVPVHTQNLEGSIAIELPSLDAFLVSQIDRVIMYDINTYEELGELPISLLKADTREPNQVIAIQKSQDESLLAVISGKLLIKNEQKINQLFIFKKVNKHTLSIEQRENSLMDPDRDQYELYHKVVLKELEGFNKVSMKFQFMNREQGETEQDEILFAKFDEIIALNFFTSRMRTIYKFKNPFRGQPHSFQPNNEQTVFVVTTNDETKYVNMKLNQEVELNNEYSIDVIKEVLYDNEDQHFYILANKYEEKLGFYVMRLEVQDPYKIKYLIKWKNKLDIGDTNIFKLRNFEKGLKELIISYKTIFINTYNVICMDISVDDEQTIIFRHESFQLWESECRGLLLTKNKDFVTINKQGIQTLSLGQKEKRVIKDSKGMDWMLHSLESCNFLKIDQNNYLLYECAQVGQKIVSIQQEYTFSEDLGSKADEAGFWRLYNVKLHDITLRQLLLFQSLYVCKTITQIVDIVNDQPNPTVFYKSFLELDGANMVSILSFDSRSMYFLLHDDFKEYFSSVYPLFYKIKIQKGHSSEGRYFYRSAIDSALRNNQVKAVSIIIDYIVKYQNYFVSSFLFQRNMPIMIDKGIEIKPLLDSDVFSFNFDLDEWPSTHFNPEEVIRPFTENIFQIRKHYRTIFPEDEFASMQDDLEGSIRGKKKLNAGSKIYKISYSINFLPMLGAYVEKRYDPYQQKNWMKYSNDKINFLGICVDSDELVMFESESMQELIDFKWQAFGWTLHLFGFTIHCIYIIILFLYTDMIYIEGSGKEGDNPYSVILLFGILYPAIYETIQMFKIGLYDYFSDIGNWVDLIYIWGSIAMSQLHGASNPGPYHWISKLFMIVVIVLAIRRTFSFLRIFKSLSPIVTMLNNVIWDLRIFNFFYIILLICFSLIYGVIGLGNYNHPGIFRETFFVVPEDSGLTERELAGDAPGIEYNQVGQLFGNIISTMRVSLGDFGLVGPSRYMTQQDNMVFWFVWFLTLIMTNIIFLNFIVAEASASYAEVSEQLENYIQLQRADLVSEAESLYPNILKTENKFPKYLAIRKVS